MGTNVTEHVDTDADTVTNVDITEHVDTVDVTADGHVDVTEHVDTDVDTGTDVDSDKYGLARPVVQPRRSPQAQRNQRKHQSKERPRGMTATLGALTLKASIRYRIFIGRSGLPVLLPAGPTGSGLVGVLVLATTTYRVIHRGRSLAVWSTERSISVPTHSVTGVTEVTEL